MMRFTHTCAHTRTQIERYLEGKAIAKKLGNRAQEASAYNDLGLVYSKIGQHAKAVRRNCLRQCLSLSYCICATLH